METVCRAIPFQSPTVPRMTGRVEAGLEDRAARIARIRAQIAAGAYVTEVKLSIAAARLLEEAARGDPDEVQLDRSQARPGWPSIPERG